MSYSSTEAGPSIYGYTIYGHIHPLKRTGPIITPGHMTSSESFVPSPPLPPLAQSPMLPPARTICTANHARAVTPSVSTYTQRQHMHPVSAKARTRAYKHTLHVRICMSTQADIQRYRYTQTNRHIAIQYTHTGV